MSSLAWHSPGGKRDATFPGTGTLRYHDWPRLNFPDEPRALGAATLAALRRDVHRERKKTTMSQYRRVCSYKGRQCWNGGIHVDGVDHHLGYFDDGRDAALAYDASAPAGKLDFP